MTVPEAAYNFDEASGNVVDCSGHGHDWALNNNAVRVAGHTNTGLGKNGSGMPVIASPSFLSPASWTIMFWQQNLGDGVWWMRLYNNGADSGSGILNLGGVLRVRIKNASGNNEAGTAPPSDGNPHHYAATYDGDKGRLYIDAVLVATTVTALSPLAIDRIDCAEGSLNFYMDDMRFFTTALSQSEISSLKDTPVTISSASRWQRGDGVSLAPFLKTSSGLVALE